MTRAVPFPPPIQEAYVLPASIDLVFDVGANAGEYACSLYKAGFQGTVVCFEPLTCMHRILAREAARVGRKCPGWRVHPRCALGDHDGEAIINVLSNAQAASSSILPLDNQLLKEECGISYVATEKAPLFKLDTVALPYLAAEPKAKHPFLKLDVQGYEWEVLDGAAEVLPLIQGMLIELTYETLYVGQRLAVETLDRLERLGFKLRSTATVFTHPDDDRVLQVDALLTRD